MAWPWRPLGWPLPVHPRLWHADGPQGPLDDNEQETQQTTVCKTMEEASWKNEQIYVGGGNKPYILFWKRILVQWLEPLKQQFPNACEFHIIGGPSEQVQRRRSQTTGVWYDQKPVSSLWRIHYETTELLQAVCSVLIHLLNRCTYTHTILMFFPPR